MPDEELPVVVEGAESEPVVGEPVATVPEPVLPATEVSPAEDPVLIEVKKIRKSVARQAKALRKLKKDGNVGTGTEVPVPPVAVRGARKGDLFTTIAVALGATRRSKPPDG
jgi:hypothetical protein